MPPSCSILTTAMLGSAAGVADGLGAGVEVGPVVGPIVGADDGADDGPEEGVEDGAPDGLGGLVAPGPALHAAAIRKVRIARAGRRVVLVMRLVDARQAIRFPIVSGRRA